MTATLTDTQTASNLTRSQEIALDWLKAKDTENEGKAAVKAAEKIRKQAGLDLLEELGEGGIVTVNKGGFCPYKLTVSPFTRTSDASVLNELVIRHPELAAEVEALRVKHTNRFEKIALKRLNS